METQFELGRKILNQYVVLLFKDQFLRTNERLVTR